MYYMRSLLMIHPDVCGFLKLFVYKNGWKTISSGSKVRRGVRNVHINSFHSHVFRQKSYKIIGWCRHFCGWRPLSGKSWIRQWLVCKTFPLLGVLWQRNGVGLRLDLLRSIHTERKRTRKRKLSLMFVVYSLICFACSQIFFDFTVIFAWCE